MNDLQPTDVLDVICTIITEPRQADRGIEIDSNTVYWHLTDHDYLPKRPRTYAKKPKKEVKITELKAIYNCTTCGYRTMDRDVLHKHKCLQASTCNPRRTTNKLPKGYELCTKCNFNADNKTNLIQHMESHIQSIQKKCTDCFLPKSNGNTEYRCSKCNYTTKNPTSLKLHMHIHTRGSPYKCTECSFSGADLKGLIKHYDTVRDLRCFCGYATHVKQQMATHMRSHTGEKPFSCGICNYSTSDRAALHKHMNKRHIV